MVFQNQRIKNLLSIGSSCLILIVFSDFSFKNLRRVREHLTWQPAQNPVLLPRSQTQEGTLYGLEADEAEFIQLSGPELSRGDDPFQSELLKISLSAIVPAAIAGYFRKGEGEGLSGADLKAKKKEIDLNAVIIADRMLIELSRATGFLFILEGAEGPGRDQSAGGLPGQIYFWDRENRLPRVIDLLEKVDGELRLKEDIREIMAEIQQVSTLEAVLPRTVSELLQLLENLGIAREAIKGIVGLKQDAVENTNALAKGEAGAWSFLGATIYDLSSSTPEILNARLRFIPDGYFGGFSYNSIEQTVLATPYELPEAAFSKLARQEGKDLAEFLKEIQVVILGGRARHQLLVEELEKLKQEYGLSYYAISDGDAIARLSSLFGNLTSSKRIFVMGASGSNEAYAIAQLASQVSGARIKMGFATTDKARTEQGISSWWDEDRSFSEKEIREYRLLGIRKDELQADFDATNFELPAGAEYVLSAASITGARSQLIGQRLGNLLPGVKIIPQGEGASIVVATTFVYKGRLFVARLNFFTSDLERTRQALKRP